MQRRWCHFLAACPIPSLCWREQDSNRGRRPAWLLCRFSFAPIFPWRGAKQRRNEPLLKPGPCYAVATVRIRLLLLRSTSSRIEKVNGLGDAGDWLRNEMQPQESDRASLSRSLDTACYILEKR